MHRIIVNKQQFFTGLAVLFFGLLIYVVDRPPDQTYFVYNSSVNFSLYNDFPKIFGNIGNNLSAFIHVFSFIMITAGFISCHKRGYFVICMFWFLVDILFELGQRFSSFFVNFIPDFFEKIPIANHFENYFTFGTFDFFDLFAITIGTAAAYWVLLNTKERTNVHIEK